MRIRTKFILVIITVLIVGISSAAALTWHSSRKNIVALAVQGNIEFSAAIEQSVRVIMLTGKQPYLEAFLQKMRETRPIHDLRIIRSAQMRREIGDEDSALPADDLEREALSTGQMVIEEREIDHQHAVRTVAPIKVDRACLSCHSTLKDGGVAGVLSTTMIFEETLQRMSKDLLHSILIQCGLILLIAGLIYFFFHRHVLEPVALLSSVAKRFGKGDWTAVADLKTQADQRSLGADAAQDLDEIFGVGVVFQEMVGDLQRLTITRDALHKEVTQREQAERLLKESEQRFFDVFYASKDAILLLHENHFIDANEAAALMLGYPTREAILRTHPSKLSPSQQPDGRHSFEKADEMIRLAFEKGFHQFEWMHRKASGEDFPVQVSLTPITLKGAQVLYCVWVDLSRQKQDEQLLRESQRSFKAQAAKLQLILASTADGVFGLDTDGKHTFVNASALGMLGYAESELIGKGSHAIWHHSHPDGTAYPSTDCPNYKVLQDGQTRNGEEYYWRKDGMGFPVEYSVVALVEDGKKVGVVVSFRDITERKKAQADLRQSEERMRVITDSAQDGIIMIDPKGSITFWNPAAERIFGYRAGEALGKNLHQLIVPERFQSAHQNAFPEFIRSGKGAAVGKTLELAGLRKDGTEFSLSLSLSSVQRPDGWHAVGIVNDISERVKAREDLLTLTRAIEQSPVAIVITDLTGAIEYVNPHFTRLTGYTLREALGQNPRILKTGDLPAEVYKHLWETITRGDDWSGEFQNKKKNGEFFWEKALISPIRDSKGKITHYLAVKEDITGLKKAEGELNRMRGQLIQADKLATLGEMATGMAHEINQPLGGIALVAASFRKFMEKKVLSEDKLEAGLRDIDASIKRMTQTIDHIRVYARQGTLEFQNMDLPSTIDAALTLMGEQLRVHGIEVVKKIDPALPQIVGEAHQLEQVWINLISNARDAMDDKEKQISTGKLAIADYRKVLTITVGRSQEPRFLSVVFSDTGMGMSAEQQKKIFDPFFTTKEVGKGTGLGLSISQGIIQRHNGKIEVSTRVGEGTSFMVSLPLEKV